MKFNNIIKFIVAVAISEFAGIIGAFFTAPAIQSGWYAALEKSALNPPDWIFGPVWAGLYFLIGISLFLVWKNDWEIKNRVLDGERKAWNKLSERLWTGDWRKANIIAIFAVQYILSISWSIAFFGLQSPASAFFVILSLWFAIIWKIANFYRVSKAAAYLLLPYFFWVGFAAYLNYSIWTFNYPTDSEQKAVYCTMEAKLCPDGSYVGRTGPNCEFTPCPKEDLIRVSLPRANEAISSPLLISGEARGNWFFEASFPVILVDWDGKIIAQGVAAAQGDWMTENFVPFKAELEFKKPEFIGDFSKRGALILRKDNPSGLPEHDDDLEIPIIF